MFQISQGDLLRLEGVSEPVLVVSKDYFNRSEQIIACPFLRNAAPDPLHITISTKDLIGVVLCEQLKLFDLRERGYKKIAGLDISNIMDVTDAIQGIFDYY
ncbi:MAG: type II toxin-antitoxin system PemK/MazF family toxin [Lachnospiraceae bacterium]|nr:type II toxin-antitoxin system PemK/MazF family toxin [Lachnospiraceae bacterium]